MSGPKTAAAILMLLWASAAAWAAPEVMELMKFAHDPTGLVGINIGPKGSVYFSGGTATNREPWRSDGTKSGTKLLREIHGSLNVGSFPTDFVHSPLMWPGGLVLFTADDGGGRRIWIHKLAQNTVVRADELLLYGGNPDDPKSLTKLHRNETDWNRAQDALLFSTNGELGGILWMNADGPRVAYHDINPGDGKSFPREFGIGSHFHVQDRNEGAYHEALFFSADDGVIGREYVRWDFPSALTKKDLRPGSDGSNPSNFTAVQNKTFFSANNGTHGTELWMDDGRDSTAMVKDIAPGAVGSSPMHLTRMGGAIYFTAFTEAHGRELWKSDGTAAGTIMVKDISPGDAGSGIRDLKVFSTPDGPILLFVAQSSVNDGYELWKSDGTAAGTARVKDINPGPASSNPSDLTPFNNKCYFVANDGIHGRELWVTDGSEAGTKIVRDFVKGATGGNPRQLTVAHGSSGSQMFFTVGSSLYRLDPDGVPPPNAPSNVRINLDLSDWDSLCVHWTRNALDADGYYIYYNPHTPAVPTQLRKTVIGDFSSDYVSNLTPNTLYALTVTAFSDEGGESLLPTPHYITQWTNASPPTPSQNITSSKTVNSWFGNSTATTFSNPQGFGLSDKVTGFQWVWNSNPYYNFSGSEPIWNSGTLTQTVAASGDYYLHVRSTNGEGVATLHPTLAYGPFRFDLDPPTAPETPVGMLTTLPNFRFDWKEATDTGGSGVISYDCQIGTVPGGNDVFDGNVGSALFKSVSGTSGATYYARVRAVDVAGNRGPWSADSTGLVHSTHTGSLAVSITPALAVVSGAQWRRVGTEAWFAPGGVESNAPVGRQIVEFKDLNNWLEPERKIVTIVSGQQTSSSGAYRDSGNLRVTIYPQEAVDAGAQWRFWEIQGFESKWHNSGDWVEMSSGQTSKSYVIEFKRIPGWGTPQDSGATITKSASVDLSAVYSDEWGSLRVTLSPDEAISDGAQWRLAETDTWLDSGVKSFVPAGKAIIEFKALSGWTKPANRSATIQPDKTTHVQGAHGMYTPHMGSLMVTIGHLEAQQDDLKWRRAGTEKWRSIGVAETNVPAGLFTIEFLTGSGWRKPANQSVFINNGETTAVEVDLAANSVPILRPIGNKSIQFGRILNFTIRADDDDGDTLQYSTTGAP